MNFQFMKGLLIVYLITAVLGDESVVYDAGRQMDAIYKVHYLEPRLPDIYVGSVSSIKTYKKHTHFVLNLQHLKFL